MQEIIFQVLYMNLSTRVFPVQMPPRFIVSRIISQGHQAPLCNLNLLTYQNVCIP